MKRSLYFKAACLTLFIFLIEAHDTFAQTFDSPRLKVSINSQWDFHKGEIEGLPDNPAKDISWEKVNIPHTWNATDVSDDVEGYYRGVSWYKRKLEIPANLKGKKLFLHFEGANQETEVYVNGKSVGRHSGGYTAFTFPISEEVNFPSGNATSAINEIVIKVDNSYNEDIPTLTADFTFFGGIYRDVYLVATEPVHFDVLDKGSKGVFITTPQVSHDKAQIQVKTTLVNESGKSQKFQVVSTIRDADFQVVKVHNKNLRLKAGEQSIVENFMKISEPKLWSPDNPYLYQVTTAVYDSQENLLDEIVNPLGLRWFSFDTAIGFQLNGEPLKLIGTNRHQDFKGIGNALPDELHKRDVELLKQMGGNFLRVAHYPHDPTILETCDRLGILAAVEIPIVNRITESEGFYTNSKNMQVEMIRQNFNHPSVIIWAYMNEVLLRPRFEDDKERQEIYYANIARLAQELEDITRKEDPYRYTMIPNHGAFSRYKRVGLTDIPMIVGWNLYSGWYSEGIEKFAKFLDIHHAEFPSTPMIVTEYGADADPRQRSFDPERFDMTVEYANFYHKVYLEEIMKRDFVVGATVWNLADFNSETRHDVVPHVNNKGITGLDRVPKDTYYYYQAHFLEDPFIRIASRNWIHRGGTSAKGSLEAVQPLEVYTNLDSAYLTINGEKLPLKKAENKVIDWQVPFVDGINTLEVVAEKNGKLYKDYLEVEFDLFPDDLRTSKMEFNDLAINLGTHQRIFVDDLTHQLWMPDQVYREGSWGHLGGKTYEMDNTSRTSYGTDQNIKGTDLDPVYQTQQVGIEEYKVDVPNGVYDVILHLADFETEGAAEVLAYNLASEDEKIQVNNRSAEERIFSIFVNGVPVFTDLNLAKEFKPLQAVSRKTRVNITDNRGILVDFKATSGDAVLNGIEIKRIY